MPRLRRYEQVAEQLRRHVAEAKLVAGDRLPGERELAERLRISRTSVREALVALEVQGLIEVRHGGGAYLRRDHLDLESMEELLDRKRRLPDVMEAREAMETKLAALAAARRTKADLAVLDEILDAMEEAIARGEYGLDEDARFHAAVATAARSSLLADLMRRISPQITESRLESLRQPGRPAVSLAQHRRIAAAIRDGDPEAATAAMREHLLKVGQVKLLDWSPNG
ncbi:FadR/GntR family transcriptional regulator [Streptomyces atratus]|uniref:FadR/GntR family transcriptional regulator n=1 Tax=Streptomyces atratus TaxID=1893 RepID=UPI00167076EB|nr:FadR/GntR family transcriptional regulator [Streptomyces atratus]WPW33295.1 FadR/GntR family transcriptional regulator [Streptomyces atratus]